MATLKKKIPGIIDNTFSDVGTGATDAVTNIGAGVADLSAEGRRAATVISAPAKGIAGAVKGVLAATGVGPEQTNNPIPPITALASHAPGATLPITTPKPTEQAPAPIAPVSAVPAKEQPVSRGTMKIEGVTDGIASIDSEGGISRGKGWPAGSTGNVTVLPAEQLDAMRRVDTANKYGLNASDVDWEAGKTPGIAGPRSTEDFLGTMKKPTDAYSALLSMGLAQNLASQDMDKFKAMNEAQDKKAALAIDAPLKQAQTRHYDADAKLKEAMATPEYMNRQVEIAKIKDQAAAKKEQEKEDNSLVKSWLKGAIGSDPSPEEMATGLGYMKSLGDFNQKFDSFVERLSPTAQQEWVAGFKAGDPKIVSELAKRGIVRPTTPTFAPRLVGGE